MMRWHEIPGFDGSYRIGKTDMGKILVKSVDRKVRNSNGVFCTLVGRELKRIKSEPGRVKLSYDGKTKSYNVKKLWEKIQGEL
ncbi:MAG: hypothetical protein ACPG5Z_00365 [Pseudoalteromonas sp.]